MRRLRLDVRLDRLPVSVKLPLVVMIFMGAVAAIASERVLTRLAEAQTRHLEDLALVHLDTLSSALVEPLVRDDVWEAFALIARAHESHAGLKPTLTVVARADGSVLAASDPRAVPAFEPIPEDLAGAAGSAGWSLTTEGDEAQALAQREVTSGGVRLGSIHTRFDVTPFLEERRSVLWTLVVTNGAVTLSLSLLAWAVVRRMMRPMQILAETLQAGAEGEVAPIPAAALASARGEVAGVFRRFNALAAAVREREALARKLAEEERLASLGRLASSMAHEINNPLGGLLNAVDTLEAHGDAADVRDRSLGLIRRGLHGIRDVVRSTLATYRPDREARDLRPTDLDDLRLLVDPEVRRKTLGLVWHNRLDRDIPGLAGPIRQIALNLLLNACAATPPGGRLTFEAVMDEGMLELVVADGGAGMPQAAVDALLDGRPDEADGGVRIGIGLGIVRRLAGEAGGRFAVENTASGARVRVRLPMPSTRGQELRHVA
ncbi:HAMP domain-containing sensor histidine kinase [Salinarimonas sp.]|uniref:sensor histidine kinase n=1 Tax=Salinarimonas sp. TaxID=2766526 RepID=UPI0032D8C822